MDEQRPGQIAERCGEWMPRAKEPCGLSPRHRGHHIGTEALDRQRHRRPLVPDRFWALVAVAGPDECWTWKGSRQRYGYYDAAGERLAHRVSWVIAHGPVPEGVNVLHRCDNPPCVNPAHLFLGTQRDNVRDCWAKGRGVVGRVAGEDHYLAKVTEADVREIRRLWATGAWLQREIGERFGLGQQAIHLIVKRKTWVHVDDAEAAA